MRLTTWMCSVASVSFSSVWYARFLCPETCFELEPISVQRGRRKALKHVIFTGRPEVLSRRRQMRSGGDLLLALVHSTQLVDVDPHRSRRPRASLARQAAKPLLRDQQRL